MNKQSTTTFKHILFVFTFLISLTHTVAQTFQVDKNATIRHIGSSDLDDNDKRRYTSNLASMKIELKFQDDSVYLNVQSYSNNTYEECLDSFIVNCKIYKDAIVFDDKYVFDMVNSNSNEKEVKAFLKSIPNSKKINELYYKNTYYIVYDEGLSGLKNYYGKTILDTKYDKILPSVGPNVIKNQSLYRIEENGRYYLYDASNGRLNKDDYEQIGAMFNGTMLAVNKDKYFILNSDGIDLNNGKYDLIKDVSIRNCENYIFVKKDNWALADREGNLITELKYDELKDFGKDVFKFKIDNYWGVMDNEANYLIEPENDEITRMMYKDVYVVKKAGEVSLFSKNGKLLIKSQYKSITNAKENLLIVKTTENKYGYIDWQGELVIEDKYEFANSFKNGGAIVKMDNKYGVIDTKGETIIDINFKYLISKRKGYEAKNSTQSVYFDFEGKCIENCESLESIIR